MELRQLRYLVTVAEEANFTRAAERLHVAQPGVSAQVRQLERELGHELLDRSGRTVRLTEVGAAVLPYARAALSAVEGARRAVDELSGLVLGDIAVGMIPSCGWVDVPDLLARFHAEHPGVRISLVESTSADLVDGLQNGRLDLAFLALGVETPPGVAMCTAGAEPAALAVRADDPLYGRRTIPLEALRDRPLVAMPRGSGLRSILEETCAATGFTPWIVCEASDPQLLLRFVDRGLGAAVVTASMVARGPAGLRAVTITKPRMPGRVGLAWRAEGPSSPAARAVVDHARRTMTAQVA